MTLASLEAYWKHTALNFGQAVRDVRYFYYHPEVDSAATEGTLKHYTYSFVRRVRSLGNNLFYSVIPPQWHHSEEDLEHMRTASAGEWFLHGYAPWEFTDPTKK